MYIQQGEAKNTALLMNEFQYHEYHEYMRPLEPTRVGSASACHYPEFAAQRSPHISGKRMAEGESIPVKLGQADPFLCVVGETWRPMLSNVVNTHCPPRPRLQPRTPRLALRFLFFFFLRLASATCFRPCRELCEILCHAFKFVFW